MVFFFFFFFFFCNSSGMIDLCDCIMRFVFLPNNILYLVTQYPLFSEKLPWRFTLKESTHVLFS